MASWCQRCGKRTAEIHTCTSNPVIGSLREEIARITKQRDELAECLTSARDYVSEAIDKRVIELGENYRPHVLKHMRDELVQIDEALASIKEK